MTVTWLDRKRVGDNHEYGVIDALLDRNWATEIEACEKRWPSRFANSARQAGVRFNGPDLLAVRLGIAWAIDCKTSMVHQRAPGCNWYRISYESLLAMETYERLHHIRGCFVVGDMWVLTPDEIRSHGRLARSMGYYIVHSGAGREFNVVFGRVEGTGEFALRAA